MSFLVISAWKCIRILQFLQHTKTMEGQNPHLERTTCLSEGTTKTEVGSGQQNLPLPDLSGSSGPDISVSSQSNLSPMMLRDMSFRRSSFSTFSSPVSSPSTSWRDVTSSWRDVTSSSQIEATTFWGEIRDPKSSEEVLDMFNVEKDGFS